MLNFIEKKMIRTMQKVNNRTLPFSTKKFGNFVSLEIEICPLKANR